MIQTGCRVAENVKRPRSGNWVKIGIADALPAD